MSWCDMLAATPSVGFGLAPNYTSVGAIQDALAFVMNRHASRDKAEFSTESNGDPFTFSFTTNSGFQYHVEPTKVFVAFRHRMKIRATSGGPPTVELLSRALPFTEMLPEVTERALDTVLALPDAAKRQVYRIGLVASVQVTPEEAPPGILRFVEYMSRPWGKQIESYGMVINAQVGEDSGQFKDRCVHTIQKPEDADELLTFSLDFQRSFDDLQPVNKDGLEKAIVQMQKAALAYFEDVGEGNRFDEYIISGAAQS